jgi:hypothetical protein
MRWALRFVPASFSTVRKSAFKPAFALSGRTEATADAYLYGVLFALL